MAYINSRTYVVNAFAEPNNFLNAQVGLQVVLDLLFGQMRVSVLIQQALLGRDQRALAVNGNRSYRYILIYSHTKTGELTSFEHHVAVVPSFVFHIRDFPSDQSVVVVEPLFAPIIESELHASNKHN